MFLPVTYYNMYSEISPNGHLPIADVFNSFQLHHFRIAGIYLNLNLKNIEKTTTKNFAHTSITIMHSFITLAM